MIAKTMTYEDFDGNTITETFYFNLSQAEITEMEYEVKGGFQSYIKTIVDGKDIPAIMRAYKQIICTAYGIKSPDGKRFVKSKEVLDDFLASQAYSDLYMELIADPDKAAAFVKGVMPKASSVPANNGVAKGPWQK